MSLRKLLFISLPTMLVAGGIAQQLLRMTQPARRRAPEAPRQIALEAQHFGFIGDFEEHIELALERDIDTIESERVLSSFDPELGWTNRPGRGRMGKQRVVINVRSGRGAEPTNGDASAQEVLCFGDSFTFGSEVGDAECWPALLNAPGTGLAAWNMGVGAYGTDQALLRFRGTIEHFDPDVVLFGFLTENIARNVNRTRNALYPSGRPVVKPRFLKSAAGLELLPQPFQRRSEVYRSVLQRDFFTVMADHEYWLDQVRGSEPSIPPWWLLYEDRSGEPVQLTVELLATACREALEAGASAAAVVLFPAKGDLTPMDDRPTAYWRPLCDLLEARGVPIIDGIGALRLRIWEGTPPEDLYRHVHLSPLGNAVIAQAVETWIHSDAR